MDLTPREKADEIYLSFLTIYENDDEDHFIDTVERICKKSAKLAVDEIINSNPTSPDITTDTYNSLVYWNDVKAEIETL
jgi:hypothetical protein